MTPRTKEQNEAIRSKRIFQIRTTAAEVYLEKGINMEIGDIAKKAGLGRGTVYHYYSNKMTLLEELLVEAMEEAKQITIQTIRIPQCPLVRLEKFAEAQLSQWLERSYLYILFKHFFQPEPVPVQNQEMLRANFHTDVYSPVLETIKEAIDSKKLVPLDPETICQFYFGTLIGTVSTYYQKKLGNELISPGWGDGIITLLINGLRKSS